MNFTRLLQKESMPNLCINCIHYKKNILQVARCTYERIINNVDGTVDYNFVEMYRRFICEGKFYKKNNKNFFENIFKASTQK